MVLMVQRTFHQLECPFNHALPTHVQTQYSKPKIINYFLNKIMFNFSLIFSTYSEYTLYAYIPFRV